MPDEITQKKSSGDVYGNQPWESAMGMTYETLDQALLGLENKFPEEDLLKLVGKEALADIKKSIEVSKFMQHMPIVLD